jgi:hypothetical protein
MNKKKKPSQNNNKNESYLLVVMIVLAIVLLLKDQIFQIRRQGQSNYNSVEELPLGLQSRINSHLKDGARKTEILKEKMELENAEAMDLNSTQPMLTAEERRVYRLRLDQENMNKKLAEEFESKNNKNRRPLTPDERLAQKLERDQYIQDYNKKYEDEYVRQFIENARNKGVNIRLDDDLNVTGMNTFEVEKPIRVPQSIPKDGVK